MIHLICRFLIKLMAGTSENWCFVEIVSPFSKGFQVPCWFSGGCSGRLIFWPSGRIGGSKPLQGGPQNTSYTYGL